MSFRGMMAGAVLVLAGWYAGAQEPPSQEGPIHTLRVFANLIQIPTLVLDESARPVEEKTHPKFMVSIDRARPFAASHARLQGEDALSLTVLFDTSGGQEELLREMLYVLPSLAPASEEGSKAGGDGLRTHDHVSLYAVDCAAVRTLEGGPAIRSTLKAGMQTLLKNPAEHGQSKRGSCASKLLLRDTLMKLTRDLSQLPGRRVLLAVTAGQDGASKGSWNSLQLALQQGGVTMFGLATAARGYSSGGSRSGGLSPIFEGGRSGFEHDFQLACEVSGGLVLTASERTLKQQMTQFTQLLRARYIVQFPRPYDATSGMHALTIEVAGKHYFIRASGATVPLADPKLKDDPTVLRVPAEAKD